MKHKALQIGLAMLLAVSVLFLALTLLQRKTHAHGGGTIYVAPGGDCGGMMPCYAHPQEGVDAANEGDTIKVAAATYTGVSGRTRNDMVTTGVVTQVVYLSKTVTIRGGYTTADWTTSDPEAHPTTLDAQGQGRVLYITGHISPTIEGLRITGGNADRLDGSDWGENAGGGVYVVTATATIRDCAVVSNRASTFLQSRGGGLYLLYSDATLSGNTVYSNTAYFGGGLGLDYSDATLSGNTVYSNTAYPADGGGLCLRCSDATLRGNTIHSNRASRSGGGLNVEGSDATLNGNTVSSNTGGTGGGLFVHTSEATLSGNTVYGNTATCTGGGLYLIYSHAELNGNTVYSNTARGCGGLYLHGSDATLINDVIADNQAQNAGSGLYIINSSPHLLHATIARNSGGDGGGVYVTSQWGGPSAVALTNTILVSHTVGISVTAGNTATLEATLWGSGAWANGADWGSRATILTGTHNYWGNPGFVGPDGADYHIRLGSAAIDRAVDAGVATDIDGHPRPIGAGFDIGADEYSPPVGVIYLPLTLKTYSP